MSITTIDASRVSVRTVEFWEAWMRENCPHAGRWDNAMVHYARLHGCAVAHRDDGGAYIVRRGSGTAVSREALKASQVRWVGERIAAA